MDFRVVVPLVAAAAVAACTFGDELAPNGKTPAAAIATWAPSESAAPHRHVDREGVRVLVAGDL
ncbi:MAG TPA: hypothetical protein VF407_20120, partial [Polyangiaceae bacterium]